MRRIALLNQKGGVGKTTTAVNLGAALARAGRRVLLLDLDPQANLSMHLGLELGEGEPSTYSVLLGETSLGEAIRRTGTPGLAVVASNIDLSGAELELSNAIGRELLLRDAIDTWVEESVKKYGGPPADYLLIDCPPSLGLLSVNGMAASREVFVCVQTQFFALQGMSKLVEVVQLLRRRINPDLALTGIAACLYDSRLRLAREVLAEVREYFPGQVFRRAVATNVKLAEAPSYGQTIFEYAPESRGARDYAELADEVMAQEPGSTLRAAAPDPTRAAAARAEPAAPSASPTPAGAAAEPEPAADLPRTAAPSPAAAEPRVELRPHVPAPDARPRIEPPAPVPELPRGVSDLEARP